MNENARALGAASSAGPPPSPAAAEPGAARRDGTDQAHRHLFTLAAGAGETHAP